MASRRASECLPPSELRSANSGQLFPGPQNLPRPPGLGPGLGPGGSMGRMVSGGLLFLVTVEGLEARKILGQTVTLCVS
jgi:hypothetical protein